MNRIRPVALVVALGLVACAHLSEKPSASQQVSPEIVAEQLAQQKPSADTAGRAALTVWIIRGDAARADEWATKALALNAGEPYALYTRMLIRREALDERGMVSAALTLVQQNPKSPLAELALGRLREVVNQSPATDGMMLETLSGLDTGSLGLEGHAALRARELLSALREGHNDDDGLVRANRAQGVVSAWSVVGPIQAFRIRDFDKKLPLDEPGHVLAEAYGSVLGDIRTRTFDTPSGVLDMEPETWRADLFESFTDVTVKDGGEYIVSARGTNEAVVFVDGVRVLARSPLPSRSPDRVWARVQLPAGQHRIRVKWSRVDAGWLSLAVARADGAPSDLTFRASPIGAAPPAATAKALASSDWGMRAQGDPASPTDRFLATIQSLMDDSDTARSELARLLKAFPDSPTLRSFDADIAGTDSDIPRANLIARIAQDLDAVLAASPSDARALLGRFQQERADKRYDDASARIEKLQLATGSTNARVLLERARLSLDRGDSARARSEVEAALNADQGRCDAIALRADLARRDGEAAKTEALVPQLMSCPGGLIAMTTHLRSRLKATEAIPLLQRMLARSPASAGARRALADALFAAGRQAEAASVLEPSKELWPRENEPLKRQAAYRELAGDLTGALELTKAARGIEAGDLVVARSMALDRHGEVLDWAARDGLATVEAYKKADFHSSASAVQVLDLGALEIQPDGASMERVQSIVQVLDKKGINQYGEVTMPSDAQPLMVRTIKADGRVLDAEIINGKESISLPNLEPGDFVEFAFLRSSGPRPAGAPGWQGGQFMFRNEDVPFFESTYMVRAPASIGMSLDSDHLDPPAKVVRDGDMVTMTYTRHGSEAYVREPMSVSDPEVLPWVEAGTGANAEDGLAQFADWIPLRARVTPAIVEFIQGTEKLPPADRVKAIVNKLRTQVKGEASTSDFGDSATTVLLGMRGNRLLALKAALTAAGVQSHFVFARPYIDYAHDFRFPHPGSYRVALLRVDLPGGSPMWVDFTLRTAPLNRIPALLSGQDAYVLPNDATESIQRITLPTVSAEDDRTDTRMELAIDAEGTLTGTIVQTAHGFDAATLRWRLEQVNATELKKQQERSLSRVFQGLTLSDFHIEDSGVAGDPIDAVSVIRVPRFTNRGTGTPTLFANFGPFYLGPRYIRVADRETPLLIPTDDLNRTQVTLKVPTGQGARLPEATDIDTPFGRYHATWAVKGDVLTFNEELLMRRGRIAPADYPAFKSFAAAVDGAQNRQITLANR